MEYFAFGETFVEEHKNSNNSPYKFNGKELDDESGLYYYGARYYDPRISIWASVDPLAELMPYMSPYSLCFQNPINFVDSDGLIPTPYEAALMANDVYSWGGNMYGGSGYGLAGGWSRSEGANANLNKNQKNGLKARMYERNTGNGQIEYAYVFAGTDDWADVGNDLTQSVGLSDQYDDARKIAKQTSEFAGNFEITYIGHSLGGGLANLCSLKTGNSAITFNPAWLQQWATGATKALKKNASRNNYVHESDPLNAFQQKTLAGLIGLRSTGKNNTVDGGNNPFKNNQFFGHQMGTMLNRMRANGQTTQHKENGSDKMVHQSPRNH